MSTNNRRVKIPKQDWSISIDEDSHVAISREIWSELKKQFDEFAVNKKVNPHHIQEGLRLIGFHKEHPDIYKVIEDLCLEYDITGKEITPDKFVQFINEHLGNTLTRQGVNILYDAIADARKGEITPEALHQLVQEIGDELSEDDVKFILETIADPSKNINISLDEFYYIMTKKPSDVVKITKVTKAI